MDRFERHIRENAAQFDGERADRAKIWQAIAQEIGAAGPRPFWRSATLKWVAGLALLIGLGGGLALSLVERGSPAGDVSRELSEVDMYYGELVLQQVRLVQDSPQLSPGDKREFLSFMGELDVEYGALLKELETNIDNERVLTAIVANYRKRIQLIENLLQQIEDKKKNNEEYGYTL